MYKLIAIIVSGVLTQQPDMQGAVGKEYYVTKKQCKAAETRAEITFKAFKKKESSVLITTCYKLDQDSFPKGINGKGIRL